MTTEEDRDADALQPVIDQLRAHRPEATPYELDAIQRRVRDRTAASARTRRSSRFMKSRITILTTLVLGMLLSTTGASLAVTGLVGDDAGNAQYGAPTEQQAPQTQVQPPQTQAQPPAAQTPAPTTQVLPETEESQPTPAAPEEESAPEAKAAPETGSAPSTQAQPLQPTRQVEAGADGDELPFTGLAAIPILVGGVALLGAGAALRRRARE
jgi:hypothetical protein